MSRIRTIKPEFFRDELLQDIQMAYPELNPMLVFAGLWTLCDKAGRFEWKPRVIKLDILPFLDFDLNASLMLLWENGLIAQYKSGEKLYGLVRNFAEHQRISGKEAQDPAKHPEPEEILEQAVDITEKKFEKALGKQQGSNREATSCPGKEGKGKEREREREGSTRISPRSNEAKTKKTKSKKTTLPVNFQPSESVVRWYVQKQYTEDIQIHLESFVTKCLAKNYEYADWDMAFRNAITDDWARARVNGAHKANTLKTYAAQKQDNNRAALDAWESGGAVIDGAFTHE